MQVPALAAGNTPARPPSVKPRRAPIAPGAGPTRWLTSSSPRVPTKSWSRARLRGGSVARDEGGDVQGSLECSYRCRAARATASSPLRASQSRTERTRVPGQHTSQNLSSCLRRGDDGLTCSGAGHGSARSRQAPPPRDRRPPCRGRPQARLQAHPRPQHPPRLNPAPYTCRGP